MVVLSRVRKNIEATITSILEKYVLVFKTLTSHYRCSTIEVLSLIKAILSLQQRITATSMILIATLLVIALLAERTGRAIQLLLKNIKTT